MGDLEHRRASKARGQLVEFEDFLARVACWRLLWTFRRAEARFQDLGVVK